MASSCLLVGALLHHLATLAWAVQATETVALQAHAVEALHARTLKTSRLRSLRAQSHSSHGLRANVFRAATRSSARARLRSQQAPAPLYVPKMGLANVTQPTPYPPPPPVLHPWEDHQPFDTAVGNYLISGFIQQPTVTPPPSQASLDLAFACPALLTWPSEVTISAPDPCGSVEKGTWTQTGQKDPQIKWATHCVDTSSPGVTPPSISPINVYSMPNGDLFGTSQDRQTVSGSFHEIRDCGGAAIYRVEEKIYKQAGKPDPDACKKYLSCDGVVYFQWFIKDKQNKVVALTPYTTIFQDSIDITDPAGGLIGQVSRNGWSPQDRSTEKCKDAKPRVWNLKYAPTPPGVWSTATNQWPIAAFMTMLSHRDANRQPNGQVLWGNCESAKTTLYIIFFSVFLCLGICIPMTIFLVCSSPILRFMYEYEQKMFPKRMGKPTIYGN